MAIRVAINGFGRIGRAFARLSRGRGIELVAVNDLGSLENLAYLLRHDTVYGRAPFSGDVRHPQEGVDGGALLIGGKEVKFLSEKDPTNLPWKELHIDVVVESTGFFTDYEKANAHLTAGAARVIITAPVKGESDLGATVLMGLNEDRLKTSKITSR